MVGSKSEPREERTRRRDWYGNTALAVRLNSVPQATLSSEKPLDDIGARIHSCIINNVLQKCVGTGTENQLNLEHILVRGMQNHRKSSTSRSRRVISCPPSTYAPPTIHISSVDLRADAPGPRAL